MSEHFREIALYTTIIVVAVVSSLLIQKAIDDSSFQAPGSRFTGEDAIWLLENSNIVLTPDTKIEGQSTPFRDYINEGSKE